MTEPHAQIETRPVSAPVRKSSTPWAVAVVVIILLLVVGLPIAYVFIMWNRAALNAPSRIGEALSQFTADAMRPKISINEVVFSSVQDMHKEAKLVVLKATVDADVTREEGDSSWGMYWGTNVARVAVKGAAVQYFIDLSNIGTSDYLYDDASKTMSVILPAPRIDTEMVSIDPARIETLDLRGGWFRWNKQDTRDHAINELKPKVIIEANKPFLKKQAEDAGKEAMTTLLSPMAQNLRKDGIKVEVKYRGE